MCTFVHNVCHVKFRTPRISTSTLRGCFVLFRLQREDTFKVSVSDWTQGQRADETSVRLRWGIPLLTPLLPLLSRWQTNDKIARFYPPIFSAKLEQVLLLNFLPKYRPMKSGVWHTKVGRFLSSDKIGQQNQPILSFICHRLYRGCIFASVCLYLFVSKIT